MESKAIREFARRDRALVAGAKTDSWRRRKRECSTAEILAIGDQLYRHARAMRPDWPSEADRAADLAVHQRVAEALHAAGRSPR